MTHVPIDDLTFGVELEVILPHERNGELGRDALAAALQAAGLEARHESYNHYNRPHWKLTTDQTIGYANVEVVSPILRGENGFTQLRRVCTVIDAFGCRVNRSCGFHVHVGVRDQFAQRVGFFKELAKTYAKFEPIIDQVMAPSRRARNSNWCQPVSYTPAIERATTVDEIIRLNGGGDRQYYKVNFGAFIRHGTVEFRQHQGTTNAQKVENWVRFCLRLVQHSAKNTEASRAAPVRVRVPVPVYPLPRDLTVARRVRGDNIPRFIRNESWQLRELVITYVTASTPRRAGTAGRENHDQHNMIARAQADAGHPMNLWDYHRHGGRRTHLAWDVDHGYVHVVDRRTAPVVAPSAATEHAVNQPPPAAPEPPTFEPPTFERPNTDLAPVSLEGLLELIGASDTERAFFTERQMELNP